jgi:hypothetical protein
MFTLKYFLIAKTLTHHHHHHNSRQRYDNQFHANNNNNYDNRARHHNNHHQQQHNRNQSNSNERKKSSSNNKTSKIDKRDLPENNKYFCEVCDRGFKSDDKYQEHCATHVQCKVNGCKFFAAAKLVEIHYRNVSVYVYSH